MGSIEVSICDEEGNARAAEVLLFRNDPSDRQLQRAMTGADGRHEFYAGPGEWCVIARNEWILWSRGRVDVDAMETETIHLYPEESGVVEGSVRTPQGDPIGGVEVSSYSDEVCDLAWSDADGRYRVLAPAHECEIDFRRAGYGQASLQVDLEQGSHLVRDAYLGAEGTLVGSVTGPQGEPCVGAEMHIWRMDNEGVTGLFDTEQAFRTDGAGAYRISGLGEGTYNVWAEARGYTLASQNGVQVGAGSVTRADLTLARGGCIAGHVRRRTDGRPVAGAELRRMYLRDGAWQDGNFGFYHDGARVYADENGDFRIEHTPPGAYHIRALHEEHPSADADTTVVDGGVATIEMVMSAGARIAGRLIDSEGKYMSVGRAWIESTDWGVPFRKRVSPDRGKESGSYEFRGLPAGNYSVSAGTLVGEHPELSEFRAVPKVVHLAEGDDVTLDLEFVRDHSHR